VLDWSSFMNSFDVPVVRSGTPSVSSGQPLAPAAEAAS